VAFCVTGSITTRLAMIHSSPRPPLEGEQPRINTDEHG
jgi:hypothetical protein